MLTESSAKEYLATHTYGVANARDAFKQMLADSRDDVVVPSSNPHRCFSMTAHVEKGVIGVTLCTNHVPRESA